MRRSTSPLPPAVLLLLCALGSACDTTKLTVSQTAKVLARARPALQQESDYELARAAMPATLKTVEGFHVAHPDNRLLTELLAEGYCQYGTGFVEDDWEAAVLERGDDPAARALARRAATMFLRCMNYGLELLGEEWQKGFYGDIAVVRKLAAAAGEDDRLGLLWTGIGLASAINHSRDNISMVAHLPKAVALLERVIELDRAGGHAEPLHRALPHLGLAMYFTAQSRAMGGDPARGQQHFRKAAELTGGKLLLVPVLEARHYGVIAQDKTFFENTLNKVLATDPAVWPEQRLANEIAHRRARRYLTHERKWF
jgi:hypothetical protein